jgi:hypothetical protein
MVAANAEGEAVEPALAWPAAPSALLLAAGDVTALAAVLLDAAAGAAGATAPDALLRLSTVGGLLDALLVAAFLVVAGSLLMRVAAVALNIDLGAGSLNTPALAAVRVACCCFCSLHALSLAFMSASAARACAVTVPVRSALWAPGLAAVAGALLMAADIVRPLGVCNICLLCVAGPGAPLLPAL